MLPLELAVSVDTQTLLAKVSERRQSFITTLAVFFGVFLDNSCTNAAFKRCYLYEMCVVFVLNNDLLLTKNNIVSILILLYFNSYI